MKPLPAPGPAVQDQLRLAKAALAQVQRLAGEKP